MVVVGFDPGGKNAFGWALVSGTFDEPRFLTGGVCSGARNAVAEVAKNLPETPLAIGIDAPLFWSPNGDRRADVYVRRLVTGAGGHSGTVSHINSLQGACLVEGAIAALAARELWPTIAITEAHPKALLVVSPEVQEFAAMQCLQGGDHHLRDAALGALTALAMVRKRNAWHDLAAMEPEVIHPLGVKVEYWFPKPTPSIGRESDSAVHFEY